MGIGLWLAAKAVGELRQDPGLLRRQLAGQGLYAFTVNAFPFGNFHSRPVKEKVYLPDWSSRQRVDYTLDVAYILTHLLPEGVSGSISTVPVAYGKKKPARAVENLLSVAEGLEKLELRTGHLIRLALEPEPDCYLERIDECVSFFAELRALNPSLVDRYLGICLDICHVATEFEDPVTALKQLHEAGISVPKIQLSAALEVENPTLQEIDDLKAFNDGIYFHQTRIQVDKHTVTRYADLPDALAERSSGHWRVHFHVPLHYQAAHTRLRSTASLLNVKLFRQALKSTTHLETETYTYAVLPHKFQDANASVSAELKFVLDSVRKALEVENSNS